MKAGLKLVKRVGVVKVYRSSEWECFVVVLDSNRAADYETNDWADALGTAHHMNNAVVAAQTMTHAAEMLAAFEGAAA